MRFRLSARAQHDLGEIADYLHARSPHAADRVETTLIATLELLVSHPHAGRRVGKGLRRFAAPRLPYLIYYRVDVAGDVLDIVTIRHGARQPVA